MLVFSSFSFRAPSSWLTFLVLLFSTMFGVHKQETGCQHAIEVCPQYFNCTFHICTIYNVSEWKKAGIMLNWRNKKKNFLSWVKALALSGSPFFFLSPSNKKLRWFFVVKYYCFRVHYTHSTSNFWAGCYIHNTRLKVFYGSCVTETFTRWVTFFRGKSCWNWWWWCYCLSFCTGIYGPDHLLSKTKRLYQCMYNKSYK